MSLVLLGYLCSHLQNASAARLGLTSLPCTKLHQSLLLAMQKSGYISNVMIGGPVPPPPSAVSPIFSSNPSTSSFSSSDPSAEGDKVAPPPEHIITQSNVATRRLWVGLKYFRNEPVLHKMRLVSKPTRRMWMGVEQLEGICRGDRMGYVKGMRGVGESMYVSTDRGIMEIRECVERRTGGMLLCRVNPVY